MYRDMIRETASSVVMYPMNVKVLNPGIALIQRNARRKESAIPKDATLISTIGVVTKRKGQDDFLRAALPILATNPLVYIAIIGFSGVDKDFEDQIHWLVKNSGYSDRILLIPQMKNVRDWYLMSDIFALFSYMESLPAVIFEAMLYKLPVVATSVYGVSEQIVNKETGMLVPAGDVQAFREALISLISDRKKAVEMGANAKKSVLKKLSTKMFIKKFTNIIEGKTGDIHADSFVDKVGLEIGGPSGIFRDFLPIYKVAKRVDGVNFSEKTIWDSRQAGKNSYEYYQDKRGDQYISEATELSDIADHSYDFLLSCHNLEHVANPIKAISEWTRVVKPDGLIVLIVPNKKVCFDHDREDTSFEHVLLDYQNGTLEDDLTHLDEILEKHDLSMDLPAGTPEQFRERSLKNFSNRALHQHVFSVKLVQEIFDFSGISMKKSFIDGLNMVFIGSIRKDFKQSVSQLPSAERALFVGSGDFKIIGEEFLNYFIKIGGLKPTDKVLDIGCGIGRMAVPLTKYLNAEGSYHGFDIVADGIDWCIKNITSQYKNFRFHLADVVNNYDCYNPHGKDSASEYKFPYADKSFDFIFLTSVFTHMLPHDMENYISQISRVLKPRGRILITFFFLNGESIKDIGEGKSVFDFKHDHHHYRIQDASQPEFAIAYDEIFVRKLLDKYGLKIDKPISFGSWCGRKNYLSFQDIVLIVKKDK